MFGVSALGTVSLAEIGEMIATPKMFQFYFHKDRGLNDAMVERAQAAGFNTLALTVDTITGGNRERDLYTGFTSPPKLTLKSLMSFGLHPGWAFNYFFGEAFELAELKDFVQQGSNVAVSMAIISRHAGSINELVRCRSITSKVGWTFLLERYHECCRC